MSKVTYIGNVLKPIHWLGKSLSELRKWPKPTTKHAGSELRKIQRGLKPSDWKPMPTIGPGVEEIRLMAVEGQYRILYVAKFSEAIYVLHVITQKRTRKTSPRDVALAQRQYKDLISRRRGVGL